MVALISQAQQGHCAAAAHNILGYGRHVALRALVADSIARWRRGAEGCPSVVFWEKLRRIAEALFGYASGRLRKRMASSTVSRAR